MTIRESGWSPGSSKDLSCKCIHLAFWEIVIASSRVFTLPNWVSYEFFLSFISSARPVVTSRLIIFHTNFFFIRWNCFLNSHYLYCSVTNLLFFFLLLFIRRLPTSNSINITNWIKLQFFRYKLHGNSRFVVRDRMLSVRICFFLLWPESFWIPDSWVELRIQLIRFVPKKM